MYNSISYNIISKTNTYCSNDVLVSSVYSKNNFVISTYNMLSILLGFKVLYNQKGIIKKAKKSNLFTGMRKNDNVQGKVTLRKNNLYNLLQRLSTDFYSLDVLRNIDSSPEQLNIRLKIKNINKLDLIMSKEYKTFKNVTHNLFFHLVPYKKKKYVPLLGIYIYLSHFNFKFKNYEK